MKTIRVTKGKLLRARLRAIACGLPVEATADEAYSGYDLDIPGIALAPADQKTLRPAFLDTLGDRGRRKRMQAYPRRLAEERFNWQRNAEHLTADDECSCEPRRLVSRSFEAVSEPSLPQAAAEELKIATER